MGRLLLLVVMSICGDNSSSLLVLCCCCCCRQCNVYPVLVVEEFDFDVKVLLLLIPNNAMVRVTSISAHGLPSSSREAMCTKSP